MSAHCTKSGFVTCDSQCFFVCRTAEYVLALSSRNLSIIWQWFCQNTSCFVWLFWLTVQIVFYLTVSKKLHPRSTLNTFCRVLSCHLIKSSFVAPSTKNVSKNRTYGHSTYKGDFSKKMKLCSPMDECELQSPKILAIGPSNFESVFPWLAAWVWRSLIRTKMNDRVRRGKERENSKKKTTSQNRLKFGKF